MDLPARHILTVAKCTGSYGHQVSWRWSQKNICIVMSNIKWVFWDIMAVIQYLLYSGFNVTLAVTYHNITAYTWCYTEVLLAVGASTQFNFSPSLTEPWAPDLTLHLQSHGPLILLLTYRAMGPWSYTSLAPFVPSAGCHLHILSIAIYKYS
jgi:hypothetical protein